MGCGASSAAGAATSVSDVACIFFCAQSICFCGGGVQRHLVYTGRGEAPAWIAQPCCCAHVACARCKHAASMPQTTQIHSQPVPIHMHAYCIHIEAPYTHLVIDWYYIVSWRFRWYNTSARKSSAVLRLMLHPENVLNTKVIKEL